MSRAKLLGNKYKVGELIGQGAFSMVYECTDIQTHTQFAVKVLSKARLRELRMEDAFDREASALRALKYSPFVFQRH